MLVDRLLFYTYLVGDFRFIQDKKSGKFIILSPRRAKRPDVAHDAPTLCPFCPGREHEDSDIFRIGGEPGDSNWETRVIANKFPFTDIHELIIHSPDHHKNFDELPLEQVEKIILAYKDRYNAHKDKGKVYIFHNRGEAGGESLPHPHTQLTVIPNDVRDEIMEPRDLGTEDKIETRFFSIFCPQESRWPDEVWISSKRGGVFGDINEEEISDLASVLNRLIKILDLRHGHEFPFNFYIYPGENWYLRIMPRVKSLGGFEIGTGIYINTQEPNDTLVFLKKHFDTFDEGHIKEHHPADYRKGV